MKKLIFLLLFSLCFIFSYSQDGIEIGTGIDVLAKTLLDSRNSVANKAALSSLNEATGLLSYVKDIDSIYVYDGANWVNLWRVTRFPDTLDMKFYPIINLKYPYNLDDGASKQYVDNSQPFIIEEGGLIKSNFLYNPYSFDINLDGNMIVVSPNSNYIYKSVDYGRNYEVAHFVSGNYNISISSTGQYQIAIEYSVVGASVYSDDYGETWEQVQSGLTGAVKVDATMSNEGNIVMVAEYNSGIFISTDYGVNFTEKNTNNYLWSAVALNNDGVYMGACTGSGTGRIYYSHNSGDNWSLSDAPAGNWVGITIDYSGRYWAAVLSGTVYVSSDYGATWTESNIQAAKLSYTDISSDFVGNSVFVSGGGEVWKSSDYGNNWINIYNSETPGVWGTYPRFDNICCNGNGRIGASGSTGGSGSGLYNFYTDFTLLGNNLTFSGNRINLKGNTKVTGDFEVTENYTLNNIVYDANTGLLVTNPTIQNQIDLSSSFTDLMTLNGNTFLKKYNFTSGLSLGTDNFIGTNSEELDGYNYNFGNNNQTNVEYGNNVMTIGENNLVGSSATNPLILNNTGGVGNNNLYLLQAESGLGTISLDNIWWSGNDNGSKLTNGSKNIGMFGNGLFNVENDLFDEEMNEDWSPKEDYLIFGKRKDLDYTRTLNMEGTFWMHNPDVGESQFNINADRVTINGVDIVGGDEFFYSPDEDTIVKLRQYKYLSINGNPYPGMTFTVWGDAYYNGTIYALDFVTPTEIHWSVDTVPNTQVTQGNFKNVNVSSALTVPYVADAVLQFGMVAMVDAGTDYRFDVNDINGDEPIGVVTGTGATAQGSTYGLAVQGFAYVAPEENATVSRGDLIHSSSTTAGYVEFDAALTPGEDDEQVGHVTGAETKYTICETGACVNEGTETITLSGSPNWVVGEPVIYWNSGGTSIGGLTDGNVYWILSISTTDVTLSSTKGGSIVDLTSDGTAAAQYLTRLPKCILHFN